MGYYSAITISGTFRCAATWMNHKTWKVKVKVVKHKRPHIPFVSTPKNSQTSETVTESRPVILGPRGQGRDCFQSAGAQHRVTEAFHTFTKGVVTKHTQLPKLIKLCVSHSVVSDSLCPHGLQPARLLCSWDSPGKNTGVGCHFLLQGIFPTQGLNSCLLHCRQILSH